MKEYTDIKYVRLDVHKERIAVSVASGNGMILDCRARQLPEGSQANQQCQFPCRGDPLWSP